MKRILTSVLVIIVTFSLWSTAAYATNGIADSQINQVTQNMLNHISYYRYKLLVDRKYRQYPSFINELYSNEYATAAMELIDKLIDSGSVLDIEEEKYMEVLINIMAISEHDSASDIAIQNQQDNLKTFQDYALDIAEMGANAASVMTGNPSVGELEENLSTAISGLNTLAKNTDNWIGALSDLETIVQNYEKHKIFLSAIESESEGALKQAATKLQNAMSTAMKIKLDIYAEISNENFENYSEFFFEDIFFKTLKNVPEYTADDTFAFFVDEGSVAVGKFSVLKASWDLGKQIGTLIGNIAVGGENLINRVREIKVATDIRRALSISMMNQVAQFADDYSSNEAQKTLYEEVKQYVALSEYMINCDMRGEYCMYSIVANDAGLLSWFNKKSAEEAEQWYYDSCEIMESIQKKYFESILIYSDDIPSDAVEFNGHYYYLYDLDTVSTWEEAKQYCEAQGGYLAAITSSEEDDFLYSYITDAGYSSVMFGLTDQEQTDDWRWVTGEDLSYQNWHPGEPSHQGGYEHYGMYYKKNTDGTWNDGNGRVGPFLCEWGEYNDTTPPLEKHYETESALGKYLSAAKKTTETGSWSEHLKLEADMSIAYESGKTKTKVTLTSDSEVSNYAEDDLSQLEITGLTNMKVMGQTYRWSTKYYDGIAHYEYTEPFQRSESLKIAPDCFNFEASIPEEAILTEEVSGNQIRFIISGEKMTEIGINAVQQMSGINNLECEDVQVIATLNDSGSIDQIEMNFDASVKYQGYDADMTYKIQYAFS